MPRKRSKIGRRSRRAVKGRLRRSNRTDQQRLEENERVRIRTSHRRAELAEKRRAAQSTQQCQEEVDQRRRRMQLKYLNDRIAISYKLDIQNSCKFKKIKKMDIICPHCAAVKFKREQMCCLSGKVKLPDLEQPKEPLKSMVDGATDDSKHFLKNITKYDSCLQVNSFGTNDIAEQGQIEYKADSLLPFPH